MIIAILLFCSTFSSKPASLLVASEPCACEGPHPMKAPTYCNHSYHPCELQSSWRTTNEHEHFLPAGFRHIIGFARGKTNPVGSPEGLPAAGHLHGALGEDELAVLSKQSTHSVSAMHNLQLRLQISIHLHHSLHQGGHR